MADGARFDLVPAGGGSWWSRARGTMALWTRSVAKWWSPAQAPPSQPGITVGKVARVADAADKLRSIATSPTVFAGALRTSLGMASYPVRVFVGPAMGAGDLEPVDPETVKWAGAFLRLLSRPDPADLDALFPAKTGEGMIAQLVNDLRFTGNAWVAPTMNGQDVVGLTRLHPGTVTLGRKAGEDYWVHKPPSGQERWYPRRTVAHMHFPSWSANVDGELGVGAGDALAPLVHAERVALEQTASIVDQGGGDILITAKDMAAANWLAVEANRKQVAEQVSKALANSDRRAFAIGGNFEIKDTGFKPADIRAPEMLKQAESSETVAMGVTPIALGRADGNYATAVQQYRVQAELDEQVAGVVEAMFLRPLAQHFARRADAKWMRLAEQVTARIDLSTHPGYSYLRGEAIDRMGKLVKMGWTASQAADIEGMEFPEPEGTPQPDAPMVGTPAGPGGTPSGPVGTGGDAGTAPDPTTDPQPRRLGDLFRRSLPTRAEAHAAREQRRGTADTALHAAATRILDEEAAHYGERVRAYLDAAKRGVVATTTRAEGGTVYGDVDMEGLLGDAAEAQLRWERGLKPSWLTNWIEACRAALEGVTNADRVPLPAATRDDLAYIEASAAAASDYSRERVRAIVESGMNDGASPAEIQAALQKDVAFSPERALRVARTETIRSESAGTLARYNAADKAGLSLAVEWMSDPAASQWDRRHDLLDGVQAPVNEEFVLPSGARGRGPGLTGDPGEDCNCRCAMRAVEVPRPDRR